MSELFGKGHVAFEYDGALIEFFHGSAELRWKEEMEELTAQTGEKLRFHDGVRPVIQLELLNILEDMDSGVFLELLRMMNQARRANAPLMVYPRYQGVGSMWYLCHIPPEFDAEALAKVACGQMVKFALEGAFTLDGYPVYTSDVQALQPWTTHTGDTITDHAGEEIEFKMQ